MTSANLPLPALSDALRAQLRTLRPVGFRRPWLTFALLSLAGLAWIAVVLAWVSMQRGGRAWPPTLPSGSVSGSGFGSIMWVLLAATWLLAFVVPLGAALLPAAGSVLPNHATALRWAWLGAGLALAGGALLGPHLSTLYPRAAVHAWWGCLHFGLLVALVPLTIFALAIRRVALVGRPAFGAALGASAGAVGALALHFECPLGGALHVALAHGGTALAVALAGWIMGMLFARSSSPAAATN